MSLSLRVRLPSGVQTVEIAADASLASLVALVAERAGAPAESLTLSSGFPPRTLACFPLPPFFPRFSDDVTITASKFSRSCSSSSDE